MASLFQGIGGFDLIWERDCGGKTEWASEIEEFCVAVTNRRFNEDRSLICQNAPVKKATAEKRVFDNNITDSRITECGDTAFSVTQHYGTGGATHQ